MSVCCTVHASDRQTDCHTCDTTPQMPHYYRGHKRTTVTEPPYESPDLPPELLDEEGNFMHQLKPVLQREGSVAGQATLLSTATSASVTFPRASSPTTTATPKPALLRKRKPKTGRENPLDVRGTGYLSINL